MDIVDTLQDRAATSIKNTVELVTTSFSHHFIEANAFLAYALEADGTKMLQFLTTALICAKDAEKAAYEHSVVEKIAAANLINTINTIKAVCV